MVYIFDRFWPLVLALVWDEVSDEDLAQMYRRYAELHAREQRFFLAQDVRRVKIPGAAMRKKLADLNTHFIPDIQKRVNGVGVIVPNKVVAGALRAVFWISREATPTLYLTSAVECWQEAERRCSAESLKLPLAGRGFVERLDALHKASADPATFVAAER